MTEIRYGYTMRDLQRIAGHAAATAWTSAIGPQERYEAAWDGVIDELYDPRYGVSRHPTGDMLINASRREVLARAQAEQHHHGVRRDVRTDGTGYGSMPAFQRYWSWAAASPVPPEPQVVAALAVRQILPRLYPSWRRVLLARATHTSHQAAAKSLNMALASYGAMLNKARRRVLELWHEGETPSRIWRIDRLVNAAGETVRRTSDAQSRSHRRCYARTRHAAKAAAKGRAA